MKNAAKSLEDFFAISEPQIPTVLGDVEQNTIDQCDDFNSFITFRVTLEESVQLFKNGVTTVMQC